MDYENIRKYMPHLLANEEDEVDEGPIDISKYDSDLYNVDDLREINRIIVTKPKVKEVRAFFANLVDRLKEQDRADVKFDGSLRT